jgi:HSP20 family molecular chaperone IbpA
MEQKLTINENQQPAFGSQSFWPMPLFMNPMAMDPISWSNDLFNITHRNMSHMFDGFLGPWPATQHSHPFAHVAEDEKSVCIKMEVPDGLDAKDIDISANDGLLTISAIKKNHDHGTQSVYSFSYSIDLPENINIDSTNISLSHHKLNISIPKSAAQMTKEPLVEEKIEKQHTAAAPVTSMKNGDHRKEKQHP